MKFDHLLREFSQLHLGTARLNFCSPFSGPDGEAWLPPDLENVAGDGLLEPKGLQRSASSSSSANDFERRPH